MKPSQDHWHLEGSNGFYNQPVQDLKSCWSVSSAGNYLNHQLCSDNGMESAQFLVQTPKLYCSPESPIDGCCQVQDSTSTITFSHQLQPEDSPSHPSEVNCFPNGCDTYHPQPSRYYLDSDVQHLKHKLMELESAMLGPEIDILEDYSPTNSSAADSQKWTQVEDMVCRGDLKEVLVACAKAIADNDIVTAEPLMSALRQMVSVCGEPIQRVGAYMLEGMVARLACSGASIYKALRCKEPTNSALLSYMHLLYEVCPYFKFGYLSANGAIADAMKDESQIHIIDFQIAQGSQWVTLIQALAARPGQLPRLRITGIDDSTSAYARGGDLDILGCRLSRVAESCKVPFEFHAVPVSGSEIDMEDLKIQPGEALAVNFALMLHHMPDESVGTQNHRDRLLRLVKSLSPKVVTLVEHEANTNTAPFFPRFTETLNYYLAVFESIDMALPRDSKERINVEQHCLARDIVNIIACEGAERVERYELLGKWRSRFAMAGFTPYPLSSLVNATIRTLLESYCKKYRLEERDGALYLGWMDRDLVASCAWK